MGGRAAILLTALALSFAGAAAAAESPSHEASNLPVLFSFGISPVELSATKPTPARLSVSGRYGPHAAAAQELQLRFDKNLAFDFNDVPVCKGRPARDSRRHPSEHCPDAVVGRGRITVEVSFPGQARQSVSSDVVIWNRGLEPGGVDLEVYGYLPAPVTETMSIPVELRKGGNDRYDWRAWATIPKIAGGRGSIAGYSLRLQRRVVAATCRDGKLQVRATTTFADEVTSFEAAVRTCTSR